MKDAKLSRCGVCGTMEAVEWEHRDARFVELPGGIWVHAGDCLTRWDSADDDQRMAWTVQAIRWRDDS